MADWKTNLIVLWNICNSKALLTLQLLYSSDVTVVKIPNMEFLKHEQLIPWRAMGQLIPDSVYSPLLFHKRELQLQYTWLGVTRD